MQLDASDRSCSKGKIKCTGYEVAELPVPLQPVIRARAGCLKIASQLSTDLCGTVAVPRRHLKATGHILHSRKSEQINSKRAAKLHTITEEVA